VARRQRVSAPTLELPDETIISAVPTRIRQVVINLVDNGVKYTPAGRRAAVAAAASHDDNRTGTVTIRVIDTGIGIPARHLPQVFDKFYRVGRKAATAIAGTALGPAVARA